MARRRWPSSPYLLALLGGIFYCLGFPSRITLIPCALGPMIGLALLWRSWEENGLKGSKEHKGHKGLKRKLICILLFSLVIFILGLYWIPYTLHVFGDVPFPLNYFLGSIYCLIAFPQFTIFVVVGFFLGRPSRPSRPGKFGKLKFLSILGANSWKEKGKEWGKKNIGARNLGFALALTLLEYFIPQQFPAHPGHSWLTLAPYLGMAPWFGVPVFSLFSYWVSFALASSEIFRRSGQRPLRQRQGQGQGQGQGKGDWAAWIFFILFLLTNVLWPLSFRPEQNPQNKTNQLRIVQANIGNFIKLTSEQGDGRSLLQVEHSYRQLSLRPRPPGSPPIDLIIWPETAYPGSLQASSLAMGPGARPQALPDLFREVIQKQQAEFLVGGYDQSSLGEGMFGAFDYNTVFFFRDNFSLQGVYHKIKLIPFGEGLPFGPLNPYIYDVFDNIANFAKGKHFTLFQTRNQTDFTVAICYEILFSSFIRAELRSLPRQPHFLVNPTNDSWYGNTKEPYQHLFLAHWRALEFQLPIIRATNTGISSILYPDGSESERLGLFKKDVLDISLVSSPPRITFFQRVGIWGTCLLAILILAVLILGRSSFIRVERLRARKRE